MTASMSRVSIDLLIRSLREPGAGEPHPALSPEERRALALALHELFDQPGDAAKSGSDQDATAGHMRLATYLDGGMTQQEKAAFEAELARSPARRDQLISAVAWLEEI